MTSLTSYVACTYYSMDKRDPYPGGSRSSKQGSLGKPCHRKKKFGKSSVNLLFTLICSLVKFGLWTIVLNVSVKRTNINVVMTNVRVQLQ